MKKSQAGKQLTMNDLQEGPENRKYLQIWGRIEMKCKRSKVTRNGC